LYIYNRTSSFPDELVRRNDFQVDERRSGKPFGNSFRRSPGRTPGTPSWKTTSGKTTESTFGARQLLADQGLIGDMRITYIGHATLLIEIEGRRILTDPNFDSRLGRVLRRVSDPGIALEMLPKLDALLLTHAHADHLSFESLRRLPRDIPLYAPPSIATWLARLGFSHAVPLAPGGEERVGDVSIFAAAACHVGSRYAVDRWRQSANMYLLQSPTRAAFFAGDTALTPQIHHLVEEVLHERGRVLDVALLPIGHAPWWKRAAFRRGHLTPEDALSLYSRLQAEWFIPYHWGTFNHVTCSANDAIVRLRSVMEEHERRAGVKILEPGEAMNLGGGIDGGG